MNYYELSNTVTPDTIGYKNGLWQKRYVQIYRVLIVVWSVLTLSLYEWLEHLEEHLKEIVNISGKDVHTLAADIEMHRREVHERIAREHPELAERFAQRRHLLDKHLKERRPEVYRIIVQLREDNKHK